MYYHMEIFKKVDVIVTPTTGYVMVTDYSTNVCTCERIFPWSTTNSFNGPNSDELLYLN